MSLKDCSAPKDTSRPGASLKGRKRRSSADISQGGEVMAMLDNFRADINKAFVAKRKCLETFTSSSLKTSQQKIEEVWKSQQNERAQMSEDYGTQFSSVFQQWESDIQRTKDQDKKLMSLFQHQKSMFQQMRASRGQRLKMLRQLMDHYIKSMQELEVTHEEQNTAVMSELRQEMALLQKKILMNTQQEEMASVRKALQSMLM
ncbi:synaptonemal complex protein 3-like [Pygocentrus nattereri]|uniref:synaptonemal complex protein 3-like n=1 Tax=Pygocentrus nattereri TaxID=42514 RepID=UPI0018915DA6|nr:synaptonemal complex protein 3-like [Pygocentrus nattereri]XP_037388160.1 synaptonemal complex protein 3-like [Pygocentrus nattereri]